MAQGEVCTLLSVSPDVENGPFRALPFLSALTATALSYLKLAARMCWQSVCLPLGCTIWVSAVSRGIGVGATYLRALINLPPRLHTAPNLSIWW